MKLTELGMDTEGLYHMSRADQQKLIDKVMDEVLTDEAIGDLTAAVEMEGMSHTKLVEVAGENGIMFSGGMYGAYTDKNDPSGSKREAHACMYYESLRNSDKEAFVDSISKNAGIEQEIVSKAYKHIFEDKHELEKGYDYFDPDYHMAESFRRLRTNSAIQEHDIVLLRHEALEHDIMQENPNFSYEEAHEIASKTYDYGMALLKWLRQKGE